MDDIRDVQSSPIVKHQARSRKSDVASTIGNRVVTGDLQRNLGVKAMEEKMTAISQENFDLKLEVHHRRTKQAELESKNEKLKMELERVQKEMNEVVTVAEEVHGLLTLRDEALEQAVVQIILYEERIESLEEDVKKITSIRPITDLESNNETFESEEQPAPPSSPPEKMQSRTDQVATPVNQTRLAIRVRDSMYRMPSFLAEENEDNGALRSLFLPTVQSVQTLRSISGSNDGHPDAGVINSPRLSVLSESSFLSVYGTRRPAQEDVESLDLTQDYTEELTGQVHAKAVAVDQWVDEGLNNLQESSQKKSTPRRPIGERPGQFLSMDDIAQTPAKRLEKIQRTLERKNGPSIVTRLPQRSPEAQVHTLPVAITRDSFYSAPKAPSKSNQTGLPPTPDTFSTNTLTSMNTMTTGTVKSASTESIQTHTIARPMQTYDKRSKERMKSGKWDSNPRLRAQRSVTETVTSHRAGHGLDTATQSELTVTISEFDSDRTTTDKTWSPKLRQNSTPAALNPPTLFTFSTDDNEWGKSGIPGLGQSPYSAGHPQVSSRDRSRITADFTTPRYSDDRSHVSSHNKIGTPGIGESPYSARSQMSSQTGNGDRYSPQTGIPRSMHPPARRSSIADSPTAEQKRAARRQQASRLAQDREFDVSPPKLPKITKTAPKQENQMPQAKESAKSGLVRFGYGLRSASGAFFAKSQKPVEQSVGVISTNVNAGNDMDSSRATPPPISRYPKDHYASKSRLPTGTSGGINYNRNGSMSSGLGSMDVGREAGSRQVSMNEQGEDEKPLMYDRDTSREERGQAKGEQTNASKGKWFGMKGKGGKK